MSFLRLARNCGVFAKSLSPFVTDTCCASASIAKRFNGVALAHENIRSFSLSASRFCEAVDGGEEGVEPKKKSVRYDKPNRDRSNVIPVETSIEYLNSSAYKTTYGDRFVWTGYRRVHKGGIAPKKTRESCIRFKVVTTSSPCPICRDEYLVLDYRNLDLLKQFISPHTGEVRFHEISMSFFVEFSSSFSRDNSRLNRTAGRDCVKNNIRNY